MSHTFIIRASIVIFLFIFNSNGICKSGPDSKIIPNQPTNCISKAGSDFKSVLLAPAHLTQNNRLFLGSFGAITAGFVYFLDKPINDEMAADNSDLLKQSAGNLAEAGKVYDRIGGTIVAFGFTGVMLAGGLAFKNHKMLGTARILAESFIITTTITRLGKEVFGRARPYTGKEPSDFNLFKFSHSREYRSYPSGHTSSIFSMMTVIAKQYPEWWVKYPAYSIGISVALQRLDTRQHWASDVILGGAIGYWVASVLTSQNSESANNLSVGFTGNGLALQFNY
ncbi:MAG: phosphatase PAP2 family protein [Calditrichia bacterium]